MPEKLKLQTRQQIMDIWNNQDFETLNKYCCPSCRDILRKSQYIENMYYCDNDYCQIKEVVNLK